MSTYLSFIILGLGAGAIYASLAIGVVLTYKGSGVINFAHGAIAMYVAYVYAGMVNDGHYLVPPLPNPLALIEGVSHRFFHQPLTLPHWPPFISMGGPVPRPEAFAIALGTAVVLGLLVHLLIFRPLRSAPVLAKVVASVGLLLVLQEIVNLRFGSFSESVPDTLSTHPVHILGRALPLNRFLLLGIVIVITLVLRFVYKRTSFGLSVRAASENEKGAVLLGLSPDMLAGANWALASLLAGLLGILVAPITELSPTNFTTFIIPALGAALVGAFSSFEVAAAAGLVIGALQSVILQMQTDISWFPQVGTREAIPFFVIVIAIVVRGRRLPTRGAVAIGHQGSVPEPRRLAVYAPALAVVGLVMAIGLPFQWRDAFIATAIGTAISLSLVVLVGFVGQISLAQLALAGVSGYLLGAFATNLGIPFPIAPLLGTLVATGVGVLIGLPALRVRGVNLAVATLGLAFALDEFVFMNPRYSGGNSGLTINAPSLSGLHFGPNTPFFFGDHKVPTAAFAVFVFVVVFLLGLLVANVRRSASGREMVAVRTQERAAAAAGINVAGTKLYAFAISAFVAGAAGSLLSYQLQSVSETSFATLASVTALAIAYLGGITGIRGAIVAGCLTSGGFVSRISQSLFHSGRWFPFVTALGLVIAVVTSPEGVSGALGEGMDRLRKLAGRGPASTGQPGLVAAPPPEPALAGAGRHPQLGTTVQRSPTRPKLER